MIPSPTPVASSSGPQRTGKSAKGSRRYNPAKSTKKKDDDSEGEHEDGWDATLVEFQAKLHDLVYNGQPPGGLSPEVALAANIAKTVKEVLKRSVSRISCCILDHRFTDFAISATATPGHQGWRGKAHQECGGLPHRLAEGNRPSKAGLHSGPKRIEREEHEVGRLRKT